MSKYIPLFCVIGYILMGGFTWAVAYQQQNQVLRNSYLGSYTEAHIEDEAAFRAFGRAICWPLYWPGVITLEIID